MEKYTIFLVVSLTFKELRGQIIITGISKPAIIEDVSSFNGNAASVETIINGHRFDGNYHGIFTVPNRPPSESNSVYQGWAHSGWHDSSTNSGNRDGGSRYWDTYNTNTYSQGARNQDQYKSNYGPLVISGVHVKGPVVIDGSNPGSVWSYQRPGFRSSSSNFGDNISQRYQYRS